MTIIRQWDGEPITEPGIYLMRKEYYHADPCAEPSLSRSCIETLVNKSPFHARAFHPRLGKMSAEKEETENMLVGTVVDEMLLGGERNICISPYDKYLTAEAKAWRDSTRARGAIPIKEPVYTKCQAIVALFKSRLTVENFPDLKEEFPTANFQHVFIWKENGVWNRAMLDTYGYYIWDLKTSKADCAPSAWARNQLFNECLELQPAYYTRAHHKVTGEPLKEFRFAVVEQGAPHDCYPMAVDGADLQRAQEQIDYAQHTWRQCLDSGVWPGYASRTVYAVAPSYITTAWEEQKAQQNILADIKKMEAA